MIVQALWHLNIVHSPHRAKHSKNKQASPDTFAFILPSKEKTEKAKFSLSMTRQTHTSE